MAPRSKSLSKITEYFFEQILRTLWGEFMADAVLKSDNSIDVNIQDQTTRVLDIPFHQNIGTTTLGANLAADAYTFEAAASHGIQVGEQVAMYDTVQEIGFESGVLTVDGNDIGIDQPTNSEYSQLNTIVARSTIELAVNGSSTRQTFEIANPFETAEDITRIMFLMLTSGVPTLPKFGDLDALTRGVVMRVVNGERVNYWNVKSNADLAHMMYDLKFYTVAGQGQNGLAGRFTFAGPEKHGVAVRLNQGDTLEVIIQDDLTSLSSFRIMAQGHETSGENV